MRLLMSRMLWLAIGPNIFSSPKLNFIYLYINEANDVDEDLKDEVS
jgi:hypothetical protein